MSFEEWNDRHTSISRDLFNKYNISIYDLEYLLNKYSKDVRVRYRYVLEACTIQYLIDNSITSQLIKGMPKNYSDIAIKHQYEYYYMNKIYVEYNLT